MINVMGNAIVRTVPEETVSFIINKNSTREYSNTRYLYLNDDIVAFSSLSLASRMSLDELKSSLLTDGPSVVMTLGETQSYSPGKHILWGAQIRSSTLSETVDVRALTGPLSYANIGMRPGVFFDSRILIPWAYKVPRQKASYAISLVPSEHDMRFMNMIDDLQKHGINVVNPRLPIQMQLDEISRSTLILAGSLSAYILAESIGIQVYAFHTGENYTPLSESLEDYFAGTERTSPEILDFSKSISVKEYPQADNVTPEKFSDMLDKYLAVSPLNLLEETGQSIKEYFGAI